MALTRRGLAVVGVALLLVTAGCSGGLGGDDGQPDSGAFTPNVADGGGADGGDAARGESEEAAEQPTRAGRSKVRTGEVTLRVESYTTARGALAEAARSRGGFVSDSSRRRHHRENRSWTTGSVTLRVPAESFGAFLDRVRETGVVLAADTSTEDVTGRLVDLEARLENLRARRDRLRGLYENADTTEDVLAVGDRLSDVQGEIERLEARTAALEDRVALATVTVTLREPEPGEPVATGETAWYDTGVVAAFLGSVDGVLTVLRAAGVGLAYLAPYLLAFGLPAVGAAALLRRRGVV